MLTDGSVAPLDSTLAPTTRTFDLASACREAALLFLDESKHWGKVEFTSWLIDSYAPLTRHAATDGEPVWPIPLLRDVDARLIKRIMSNARAEVVKALGRMAENGSATFVLRALIDGTVVRCDDPGEPAWAPSPTATRLADRVFSLLAVDYLAHPGEYEASLSVCSGCGVVSFDETTQQPAPCHCRTENTLVTGIRRPTMPYPPVGARDSEEPVRSAV